MKKITLMGNWVLSGAHEYKNVEEVRAAKALMEAAPELLAALRVFVNTECPSDEQFKAAEAAINKADGWEVD